MLNTEARLRAMDWILIRDVFEKLCFQMSTQEHENGVFKISTWKAF